MHACLYITEVIGEIFRSLDEYAYDEAIPTVVIHRNEACLRALAALARTCKTFQEPALNVLWRDIPDFFVLLRSFLPGNLLRYDEASYTLVSIHFLVTIDIIEVSCQQHLTARPDEHAWRRLDPYVKKVRAVGLALPYSGTLYRQIDAESALYPLEEYLLHEKSALSRGQPFPNLTRVVFRHTWEDEAYCRLLLTPCLQVLHLPLVLFSVCD